MSDEGRALTLRDLLTTTKDGDWGRETPHKGFVPFYVIRGTDFPNVRIGDTSTVSVRYLNESTAARRTLTPGDILIETAGGSPGRPTGRSILITERLLSSLDHPATCASFARFLRIDPCKAFPPYIYWHLQHMYASGQMEEHQVQHTGIARFQYTIFAESVTIPLPNITAQRAIADILGTLDDKIELNRKMNETLESMAKTLFKSWFVDFDPVRAKAEGRDTGLPSHIADHFPDSFEDSELGRIPKGWQVGILDEVAKHPRRSVQPNDVKPKTPYIALEDMPRCNIALSEWSTPDEVGSNKFQFKKGEILFGKLRPYFHKVGVAPVDGVCSTDIVVVTPRSQEWFGFVLGHVSSNAFVEHTNSGSTGTRMPRTSWGEMARFTVVKPHENIAEAFTVLVQPAVDRILASIHESFSLANVRDTLLPKLISGELRVKDAAKVIGRCL